MADYWIKLYIEIIDDPKMAVLPDRLWRRTVELFLLAGKFGKDGLLPDTRQLAWMLRMSTDELEMDIKQIAMTGIIESVGSGWLVRQFKKRQEPSTAAERKRAQRDRERHEQYAGDVTNRDGHCDNVVKQINRLTDNRLTESDTESRTPKIEGTPPPIEMPKIWDSTVFQNTWNEWLAYRKESKHKMTSRTAQSQLTMLDKYTPEIASAMLRQSITNGWQGIFELKTNGNGRKAEYNGKPTRTAKEEGYTPA